MKAQRGSRSIAPLILNFGTDGGEFSPPGRTPVPIIKQEAEWAPEPVWTVLEIFLLLMGFETCTV